MQRDAAAFYYMFKPLYVLPTSIDNHSRIGSTLHKFRIRWYLDVSITDANYADDLASFSNSCCNVETLVQLLKKAAKNMTLYKPY